MPRYVGAVARPPGFPQVEVAPVAPPGVASAPGPVTRCTEHDQGRVSPCDRPRVQALVDAAGGTWLGAAATDDGWAAASPSTPARPVRPPDPGPVVGSRPRSAARSLPRRWRPLTVTV